MSKKIKDRVEIRIAKRRDDAISCFNDILKKATKKVLNIDEELRLFVEELKTKTEEDAADFEEELKKQTEQIEAVMKRLETEDGLNKKMSEEEVIELNETLLDHIDFVFTRAERNRANLDKASLDARKQINFVVDETLEMISNIWRTTRAKMEHIYSKAMDIIGARSGIFEEIVGLTEIKIKEMQIPLPGLVESLSKEEDILVKDIRVKLIAETERLESIKVEQTEKFEEYKKIKEDTKAAEEQVTLSTN